MHYGFASRPIECRTQMLPVDLLPRRCIVTKSQSNVGTLIVRTVSRTRLNQAECRSMITWSIRCCLHIGMSPREGGWLISYRGESASPRGGECLDFP